MISYLFGHISASQTLFSHRKLIKKKKNTLGLLNHRRRKKMIYIKQRNHHSIFLTPTKKKDGNWIIYGSVYNTTYIFFLSPKGQKCKFHCGAVCNAHKKPVRLFKFLCFFGSLASFCEIEEPFLLYHQGNDPSTR